MTDTPMHFFWLTASDTSAPPKQPWQSLGDAVYWENPSRAPDRRHLFGPAPDWADDLLRVARAVFASDKFASRADNFDRWTRHIRLCVPVTDPDRWNRALPALAALLGTMTGDRWEVSFRPLDGFARGVPFTSPEEYAGEVALFSGGLDSLGWAAHRSSERSTRALLFVMFEERNLEAAQAAVYDAVYGLRGRPLRRLDQSQTVRGPGGRERELELSTRSRGLLYTASAVHAAAAEEVPVVHLPENGQLAVNPPLSAARSGACSTRSVHPWALYHLNRVIEAVGGPKAPEGGPVVRVENPFAYLTKGQVCAKAHAAGLPQRVLEATLSCGASPIHQPGGSAFTHCGLCYPCLIRRSGLLHVFGEDRTPYAADPWNPDLPETRTSTWRALRRWLDREYTALDLATDTPLPPDAEPAQLLSVIEQGRKELRSLVAWGDAKGTRTAKAAS